MYRTEYNREYMRRWHAENRDHDVAYRKEYNSQRRDRSNDYASTVARRAVRKGLLTPAPCVVCGSTESVEGHHPDYTKRLKVVWLCATHHKQLHGTQKAFKEAKNR